MAKTKRRESYTSMQKGIGARIGWARDLAGLNQSQLAKAMTTDPSTLNKIEQGVRPPNVFQVIELAARLRVTTDYILRGLLLSRIDEEMGLKLAAAHPEIAPKRTDTGFDTDTDQLSSKLVKTKTRDLVG